MLNKQMRNRMLTFIIVTNHMFRTRHVSDLIARTPIW